MTRATLHSQSAAISPIVLGWALQRANSSRRELAKSVGTSESVVGTWLSGQRKPSFRQARSASDHLRLPFGFLFLSEPPPDNLPIPDFRRVHGHAVGNISLDLRDVILATLRRQSWLVEYREQQSADSISLVGSLKGSNSSLQIATSIRRALNLSDVRNRPGKADDFLRMLVERTEALGISVLRSGIVGLNTHRKLDVKEFRGFSLSNRMAPFVFVNGADAITGQIFTLIHELAHIWLGESGISGSIRDSSGAKEALCNQVAAEVLVPAREFSAQWDESVPLDEAIRHASRHFRVSKYVIAIRAFESGLLDRRTLDELLDGYDANARRSSSSGGNFYRTAIARNGRNFSDGVISALSRQQVLVRDAAALLEVRPVHLGRLARELRGRG